jgi:bifunctional DNA-binding transcriptional regulator/antitoxin component of YhaV-PrlF toxin-antitoxin module
LSEGEKKTKPEKSRLRIPRYSAVKVTRKGGALYVLVPAEIAKFLDVEEGDKLVYIKNIENKTVLMLNPDKVKITIADVGPVDFSFSLPQKLLKKVASKDG